MSNFSPSAQRVLDAFHTELPPNNQPGGLAAALRAAVEETIQPDPLMGINCIIYARDVLALAAELEAAE